MWERARLCRSFDERSALQECAIQREDGRDSRELCGRGVRGCRAPTSKAAADFVRSQRGEWCSTKVPECGGSRSEEHTSELQSPVHLVCRLLLEKKKNKKKDKNKITNI